MLHHVRAIVLHHLRYSETSLIARIYTDKFGLQSYLLKGVRSPKSRIKPGLLEHLSLLEMVVYYREGKSLQNIKELRPAHAFRSMYSDIRKSSQALFINEVVYKSVKEEESNPALFDFLFNSILELDDPGFFSPHFHLVFMLKLTRYLGFLPRQNYSPGYWFNMRDGTFEESRPVHSQCINPEHSGYFNLLLSEAGMKDVLPAIPGSARKTLLDKLIEFYGLHLPAFDGLRSPEVLHEVFSV